MNLALPSRTLLHGLVVVLALASAACADSLSTVPSEDAGGPEGPNVAGECFENAIGECVVSTDGCDPASIGGNAAEKCASCSEDGVDVEICGRPSVASCYAVEYGDECTQCTDDDGQLVWTDCPDDGALVSLDCEVQTYEPTADAPNGRSCEVCRDDTGRVVTESCGQEAEECHEEVIDGRPCEVCTAGGDVVFQACGSPELSEPPRLCEVYESPEGRCVDCYGQGDQLLSHECAFGAGALEGIDCEVVIGPSGQACEYCWNADGYLVEETCEGGGTPAPERCNELFYEFPNELVTCFTCVDENGVFTVADCWSSTCDDGNLDPDLPPQTCAEPVCESHYENGEPCRTCYSQNGESQTQCLPDGDVYCQPEEVFADPTTEPDPNQPPPEPGSDVTVCTVCRDADTGVEVHRDCDGGTEPPVCVADTSVDGDGCETCYDPATMDTLYTTCGEPMCVDEYGLALTSTNGDALTLPPDSNDNTAAAAATADCSFCVANEDTYPVTDYGFCDLVGDECDDSAGEPCPPEPWVVLGWDLTQCADPWGASDGTAGLLRMMSWALESHGVVVHFVEHESPMMAAEACEACDCLRGDRFLAWVEEGDVPALNQLGFYGLEDQGTGGVDDPSPPPP
jgi:hypothetical protein